MAFGTAAFGRLLPKGSARHPDRARSSLHRVSQQDCGPDHVALPGRLVVGQRFGCTGARPERLDEVERLALRERVGLGRQIREHGVDRSVDLLVSDLGGLEQLGDGRGFFRHGSGLARLAIGVYAGQCPLYHSERCP